MSAERLREAARVLRERAEAAVGAMDWTPDGICGDHMPVTLYIATMHPGVGLALAKWLDDVAAGWAWDEDGEGCAWDDGMPMRLDESMDLHAIKIADAILGGAS